MLLFLGLAFAALVVNILLAMFYNTVIAWAVYYLYLSFQTVVPWYNCDNPWNTACCFPLNLINEIREGKNKFYSITQKGLIYRHEEDTNKLVLFNHKNVSQFDQFKELFNSSHLIDNFSINAISNETTELNAQLMKWLNMYYINLNETINMAPNLLSNINLELDIQFDTNKAIDYIESAIKQMYTNYTIVLNCSQDTISPTQEFYSRYLTEMHKSRGLENIGGIKIEMAFCLFLVFVTVYFALWKGIKSAGKV